MFNYEEHLGLLLSLMHPGKVTVTDLIDGNGPCIDKWDVEGVDKPADDRAFFAQNKAVLTADLTAKIIADRNARIAAYNWAMFPDVELPAPDLLKITTYRKALRDLDKQAGFPEDIIWPIDPEII